MIKVIMFFALVAFLIAISIGIMVACDSIGVSRSWHWVTFPLDFFMISEYYKWATGE